MLAMNHFCLPHSFPLTFPYFFLPSSSFWFSRLSDELNPNPFERIFGERKPWKKGEQNTNHFQHFYGILRKSLSAIMQVKGTVASVKRWNDFFSQHFSFEHVHAFEEKHFENSSRNSRIIFFIASSLKTKLLRYPRYATAINQFEKQYDIERGSETASQSKRKWKKNKRVANAREPK